VDVNKVLADFSSSLDEIREMIQILGQDCREHYQAIQNNGSQTHRRAYVRAVFAFIEGVLHRTKVTTVHLGVLLGTISIHELVVLEGSQLDVNDKGQVTSKPLYPNFLNNVRLVFRTFSKSIGSTFSLNVGGQGWQNLREAVTVRDRLMHPKEITELQVSDAEVEATKQAFEWFLLSHNLCSHYAQRATHAKTTASTEAVATFDATIDRLENELAKRGN
jgi:hypothetical protein